MIRLALLAHAMVTPLGDATLAGPAVATGLSLARQLDHAPILGVGEDAAPAAGHAVLDGDAAHGARCAALLDLALDAIGRPPHDAVVLCRPLPEALRFGPDGPPILPASRSIAGGHAGAAAGLMCAAELLAAGRRRVLLLAVDSLLDPESLAWLAADERLLGPETPDGVQPGEAAAAWLLGPAGSGGVPIAAAWSAGGERSPASDAARLAALAPDATTAWCACAGTPHRERVRGHLAMRLHLRSAEHAWGELGAAAAPCLAGLALAEGSGLVLALGEDGAAGAIAVGAFP